MDACFGACLSSQTAFSEGGRRLLRPSPWERFRRRWGTGSASDVQPAFGGESLPQKILGVHRAFAEHDIAHAFGGAIALAYHAEPRATDDIDINILMAPDRGEDVIAALDGLFQIADRDEQLRMIATRDQARVLWGATYVDLFFMDTAFHESLATRVGAVDFGGEEIAIISAEDLVVCKALFNRPHDWVDIQRIATIQGARLDRSYVEHWLRFFVDDADTILARFRQVHGEDPAS